MSMAEKRDHYTCFTLLPLLLILCLHEQQVCLGKQTKARTFFGNGFIKIAPWIINPWTMDSELILRFTFQTSERNGLLLFMKGNTLEKAGHTFLVMLQEGSLVIEVDLGIHNLDKHKFDNFLNDNQPHTLTLHHIPSIPQFEYRLDEGSVVKDPYASNIDPDFGSNETYFGGAPSGIVNETNFIGCLSNIWAVVGGNLSVVSNISELHALDMELSVGRVEEGCINPCADRDCGNASCVARWPDRAFCDCRRSRMSGENCSVENVVVNFTLESEMYLCYVPTVQPSPGLSNTVSIQLVPPIPSEGTILIAQADKVKKRFNLRIEDNHLIYEDVIEGVVLNISLIGDDLLYQVDLSLVSDCSSDCTKLLLQTVSEEGEVTMVDMATNRNSIHRSTIFTTVCVGGSLLEVKNYRGRMQRVFFNYNSLLEEQNSCRLEARSEKRSNVITFASTNISRSFILKRYSLRSARIAFQVRFVDRGVIFAVENTEYVLLISSFNSDSIVVLKEAKGVDFFMTLTFEKTSDREWHQFEISTYLNQTEGGKSEIRFRYDGKDKIVMDESLTPLLASFIDTPLQFGPITDAVFSPGAAPTFNGCLRDFEFQQTAESEIFRPNLEELPRVNPAAFFVDNCYNCIAKTPSVMCSSGQVCVDPGFAEAAECGCPQGYQGPTCQDPLPGSFLSALNQEGNTTCLTLSVSTPSTSTSLSETTPTQLLTSPTTHAPIFNIDYVAIPVGMIGLVLLGSCVALCLCIIYQRKARLRGFYQTNENHSKEASMTRYSASLRQLSSERVTLSNEHMEGGWPLKNGSYSNGGPRSVAMPSSSPSNSSSPAITVPLHPSDSRREKEFYL